MRIPRILPLVVRRNLVNEFGVKPDYSKVGKVLEKDLLNPTKLNEETMEPLVMIPKGTILTIDLVELIAYWGVETYNIVTYDN